MRDIEFYFERAKRLNGLQSDRKLGALIGLSPSSLSNMRKGWFHPNDQTMLKIAEAAGVPPMVALLDLNVWRTRGEAQEVYLRILAWVDKPVFTGKEQNATGRSANKVANQHP